MARESRDRTPEKDRDRSKHRRHRTRRDDYKHTPTRSPRQERIRRSQRDTPSRSKGPQNRNNNEERRPTTSSRQKKRSTPNKRSTPDKRKDAPKPKPSGAVRETVTQYTVEDRVNADLPRPQTWQSDQRDRDRRRQNTANEQYTQPRPQDYSQQSSLSRTATAPVRSYQSSTRDERSNVPKAFPGGQLGERDVRRLNARPKEIVEDSIFVGHQRAHTWQSDVRYPGRRPTNPPSQQTGQPGPLEYQAEIHVPRSATAPVSSHSARNPQRSHQQYQAGMPYEQRQGQYRTQVVEPAEVYPKHNQYNDTPREGPPGRAMHERPYPAFEKQDQDQGRGRSPAEEQRPGNFGYSNSSSRGVRFQESQQSNTQAPAPAPEPAVTIIDLLSATRVPPGWRNTCRLDAEDFEDSLSPANKQPVKDLKNHDLCKQWLWKKDAVPLLIQASPNKSDTRAFSSLSPIITNMSKKMSKLTGRVALEFFCGRWKEESDTTQDVDVAVLRSFCYQLLNKASVQIDDVCLEFNAAEIADLEAVKEDASDDEEESDEEGGSDDEESGEEGESGRVASLLQRLFKSLVVRLPKTHTVLYCFIDGVYVFEDDDDGLGQLRRLLDHFKDCATAVQGLDLKILLTLPRKFDEDWQRTLSGRASVLPVTSK